MRFAQRPNLLCPRSPGSSHSSHLTLAACKPIAIRWSSASVRVNLAGFRPSQQKSAQVRFRCAVYSQLWAAVGFCPEAEKSEASALKGALQMANTQKTAIVTGASRGIGAGLVEAFLKRGYNVVANSRHITKANPFAASANLALVDGDIGDPRTAAKIVDTAVSRVWPDRRADQQCGCFHSEALHRIHD